MRTLRRLGSLVLLGLLAVVGLPAFGAEVVCVGGDVPPYYSEVCTPVDIR